MWLALWEATSVLCICPYIYRLYFGGYSIFMIARSIDPAPLPSDNKSTMGPGFAIVGTPGSPSDVAPTKVLLPRLLGDSVRFFVRLRSVATYWLVNQRHQSHTLCLTCPGDPLAFFVSNVSVLACSGPVLHSGCRWAWLVAGRMDGGSRGGGA